MTKFDKINSEAIYELHYQEDMRAKGIPYQVSNLVIYTAISALEKQIPKKPIENGIGGYICPHCGGVILDLSHELYHRDCGGRLE